MDINKNNIETSDIDDGNIEDIYDSKKIEEIQNEFLYLLKQDRKKYNISLENIYKWSELSESFEKYKTDSKFRNNFINRKLKGENSILRQAKNENDLDKDYIIIKDKGGVMYPWFSVRGFKAYSTTAGIKKSRYVVDYFIKLEEKYLEALGRSEKENKAELAKINSTLEKYKTDLIKTEEERDKYLEERYIVQQNLERIKLVEQVIENKDDFVIDVNPEYVNYCYLRQLHLKPVSLYIVNPHYMTSATEKSTKTKKTKSTKKTIAKKLFESDSDNNDNNSDVSELTEITTISKSKTLLKPTNTDDKSLYNDDLVEYYKNFNEYDLKYDILDNPTDEPLLYYYIGPYAEKTAKPTDNFHKIATLYVKDTKHLKELKSRLDKIDNRGNEYLYKTPKNNIYKAYYSTIYRMSIDILNEIYCEQLQPLNKR